MAACPYALDRELYLPAIWADDRERCRRAGVPDERMFTTKPELAQQMLEPAFAAGLAFAFIAGDSVYGDNRPLCQWLEERSQAYALAVSGEEWPGASSSNTRSRPFWQTCRLAAQGVGTH